MFRTCADHPRRHFDLPPTHDGKLSTEAQSLEGSAEASSLEDSSVFLMFKLKRKVAVTVPLISSDSLIMISKDSYQEQFKVEKSQWQLPEKGIHESLSNQGAFRHVWLFVYWLSREQRRADAMVREALERAFISGPVGHMFIEAVIFEPVDKLQNFDEYAWDIIDLLRKADKYMWDSIVSWEKIEGEFMRSSRGSIE